jgi:probable phosphoglycerate mutase
MELYLLRHGEIDEQYRGRFVGQIDLPLSERGVTQARWWQRALATTPFGRVYCSDLSRSQRTAEIIAENKQGFIEIMPELREINLGKWEGISMAEVKARSPEEWKKRGDDLEGYRPPGGESFSDLASRILASFQKILHAAEGNRLIVGHAGTNRVILCHVLGMPLANLFRIDQDYGCLNIIECSEGRFRLKMMNMKPGEGRATANDRE